MGVRTKFAQMLSQLSLAPPFWRNPSSWGMALVYHSFVDSEIKQPITEVTFGALRSQMLALQEKFAFMPLASTLDRLSAWGRTGGDRPALFVTIDDGERCVLRALPIFESLSIPIVLFVPIGLLLPRDHPDALRSWIFRYYQEVEEEARVGLGEPSDFFEQVLKGSDGELEELFMRLRELPREAEPLCQRELLSYEELEQLQKHPLVTIASHTMSHQAMRRLTPAWSSWEIERSLHYMRRLGGETSLFSFPYGDLPPGGQQQLHRFGIRYSFSTRFHRITQLSLSQDGIHGRAGLIENTDLHYIWGFQRLELLSPLDSLLNRLSLSTKETQE